MATAIPYCGPAPTPAALMQTWNLDPWLAVAAAVFSLVVLLSGERDLRSASRRRASYGAAFILAVAFISPLCAASTALFSARVLHHVLIVALAAPFLALAFPARPWLRRAPLGLLFAAHLAAMWLWHAPAPYIWALSSTPSYWVMEASLLVTALLLWQAVLAPSTSPGRALSALLGTTIQMGMLGALLTFAGRPLFVSHFATTEPFGLTPLADQQLAGLLMWVPAAVPYLAAALLISQRLFERRAAAA